MTELNFMRRVLILFAVGLACFGQTENGAARAKKAAAPPAAASAAPVAPPAPVILPDPPTPVQQAQQIGLGQCAPILDKMSRENLTAQYDTQSGWNHANPTTHIFQSVASLHRPGVTPADGFAALAAAPVPAGGCDGVTMQVFPLAGDCPTVQKLMMSDGGVLLAPLMDARIMLDNKKSRIILLPGYNNTCIGISVESSFGSP